MTYAIETHGLTKAFGKVLAVDSINLCVRQGEIYGFLGLNGAGKTTTIRMLLGMIGPDSGSLKVLDQPVGPYGQGPWRQVGHMVERTSAYPELSVRENLEIARRLQGVTDAKVVSHAIERLGLAVYADRKAGTLSTGNLQRLGLARALLHEPALLILDEPANGLDPAGLVEIREMLRELALENGVTVFMSSHILTEVDRLAMRIGVIHQGRLVEELDAERLKAIRAQRLEIQTHDLGAAQKALVESGYAVTLSQDRLLLYERKAVEAPEAVAILLVQAGHPPTMLKVEQENLEEHFLHLTGGTP
jgi:ABC-2 type transport system ATP-binding protein